MLYFITRERYSEEPLFQYPSGIPSRHIRHSTRASPQQKAQPLYVTAKVKIIFQSHNIFKQKNTKSLAKTKNNTYLCQYKKTKPQITLNYYITTTYTLLQFARFEKCIFLCYFFIEKCIFKH